MHKFKIRELKNNSVLICYRCKQILQNSEATVHHIIPVHLEKKIVLKYNDVNAIRDIQCLSILCRKCHDDIEILNKNHNRKYKYLRLLTTNIKLSKFKKRINTYKVLYNAFIEGKIK